MTEDTGEFGIIRNILSPLTSGNPGAFNLTDDAAVLDIPAGQQLVLTKDAMVAGVHFLENEHPSIIAKKLLRTNLSDLAAMGAKPLGYLTATAWTKSCGEEFVRSFADGLRQDQEQYGIALLGGDTVRTPGPVTLSLTALGLVPAGMALRRNSARIGDILCVSGTIGDGALGLKSALKEILSLQAPYRDYLEDRYHLPQPRMGLGQKLIGLASACLDISDGLVADIGHLCEQSNVGAVIRKADIPLSDAARFAVNADPALWAAVLGGGDDYELAFTVHPEKISLLADLAVDAKVEITEIGEITEGSAPVVRNEQGQDMDVNRAGWAHF